MYSKEQRATLRAELLECAARDVRLSGAAITGSAATGREDAWSDVDLAFGVADGVAVQSVISDWTTQMYDRHNAIHHYDVKAGAWIYRVFILPSTLQVDLAFVSEAEFRPIGSTFRLVSGSARGAKPLLAPLPVDVIGLAWLYALHARSSLARGQLWQAEYMISAVRDQTLALACLRHKLPAVHGKGFDLLPHELARKFEDSLVGRLDPSEMWRAFAVAVQLLLNEIQICDRQLALRLHDPLSELCRGTA